MVQREFCLKKKTFLNLRHLVEVPVPDNCLSSRHLHVRLVLSHVKPVRHEHTRGEVVEQ